MLSPRIAPVLAALAVGSALFVGVGTTRTAAAEGSPVDPQVARLLQAKSTMKWNYTPPGSNDRYGHAETLIAAPADKVTRMVTQFSHYKEIHRKFATARVVAKEGDTTDVYMRYPVQIGRLKVEFHEVMRFGPPQAQGNAKVVVGNGVQGDMKRGQTVIRVKPVDAEHSILEVDVLLLPKIPAPQSMIDEELRDGADDFVTGVRARVQGNPGPVVSL